MDIFTIASVGQGSIAVCTRPRGGDWLEDDLGSLARAGIHVVVSALTDEENTELELRGEASGCTSLGLTFLRLPIADRDTPPNFNAALRSLQEVQERLHRGQHAVIHCRQGIGRSCMLVAAILVLEGLGVEDAWNLVQQKRGRPVPDTPAQRAWPDAVQQFRMLVPDAATGSSQSR